LKYNTFFLDQYPEEIKTDSNVSYWHSDLTMVQHVFTYAHSNLYLFISQPSLMVHKRSDSDEILL